MVHFFQVQINIEKFPQFYLPTQDFGFHTPSRLGSYNPNPEEEVEVERTISDPANSNFLKNLLPCQKKVEMPNFQKKLQHKPDLELDTDNERTCKGNGGQTPEKFERDKAKHFTTQNEFSQNSITSLIAKKKQVN